MKDYKTPFNLFDIFGYLLVGTVFFATFYCLFAQSASLKQMKQFFQPITSLEYINYITLILGVYVLGHMIVLFK